MAHIYMLIERSLSYDGSSVKGAFHIQNDGNRKTSFISTILNIGNRVNKFCFRVKFKPIPI